MYSEKRLLESAVFLRSDVLALESENCRLREKLEKLYLVASGENGVWDKVKQAGKATWDFLVRILDNLKLFWTDLMVKINTALLKIYAWLTKDKTLSAAVNGIEKFWFRHGHPIEPIVMKLPLYDNFNSDDVQKILKQLTEVLKSFTTQINTVIDKDVSKQEVEEMISNNSKKIQEAGFNMDISSNGSSEEEFTITGAKELSRFQKRYAKIVKNISKITEMAKPLTETLDELTKTVKKNLAKTSRKEDVAGGSPKDLLVSYIVNEIQNKVRKTIVEFTNLLQNDSTVLIDTAKKLKEELKNRKLKDLKQFDKEMNSGKHNDKYGRYSK